MTTWGEAVPDRVRRKHGEQVARRSKRLRSAVEARDRALADARDAGYTLRELAELSGLSVEGVRNRIQATT